jgi:hypothetical protein
LDCVNGGLLDANKGVAAQTIAKQHRSMSKFELFLDQCGIKNDRFLDGFTQEQRVLILSGYAHHVRNNKFGHTKKERLQGSTVSTAISDVVQTFRSNLRSDPTLDRTNQKAILIRRQIKAYRDSDPARQSQACLPLIVWQKINKDRSSDLHSALGHLITGALFFAMRSCEYSNTRSADGPRKTKILTCENIQFFSNYDKRLVVIPHSAPIERLANTDCVTIRFVAQKNNDNFIRVTQYRSEKELCPVIAWAHTVKRVMGYPKALPSDTVNTFLIKEKGRRVRLTATQIRSHIKLAVTQIGTRELGVNLNRVGTHSLRTSCAMLLYLAKVRTETIKLLGRWKSDAFLLYIRRQVQEFAEGLSAGMLDLPELFHNIPEDPQELVSESDDCSVGPTQSTEQRPRRQDSTVLSNTIW